MRQKLLKAAIPAAAAVSATIVSALPAAAHEGHHEGMGDLEALRHLASQPDHMLAFAGLLGLAVVGVGTLARVVVRK